MSLSQYAKRKIETTKRSHFISGKVNDVSTYEIID